MKHFKRITCLLLSVCLASGLSACADLEIFDTADDSAGSDSSADSAVFDAAGSAITNAKTLAFDFSSADTYQDTDITADDSVVGHLQEDGIFNTTWTITVDGETWFYIKYVTDEPINETKGVISATTYGAYDANDNLLGYAQEQVTAPGGMEDAYYLMFLDADGNAKSYFSDEEGYYTWDDQGNLLATGELSFDKLIDEKIKITMQDGVTASIDPWDKIFMYLNVVAREHE